MTNCTIFDIFINVTTLIKTQNKKQNKMKKIVGILSIVALTSCGGGATETATTTDSTAVSTDTTKVVCDTTKACCDSTKTAVVDSTK